MSRFSFCGPSYTSQSVIADDERLGNMYVEKIESEGGKSSFALYSSPGTSRFCTLPDTNVRSLLFHNATGRLFAVCGSGFYEVLSDGTSSARGAVANDGLPASMAQSNIQIMIASGQHGYCFTLATNALVSDPANLVSPLEVQYDDGFFIADQANSNQFQYSNALDGTTWNALNKSAISVYPDNIKGFVFDHRELVVFGQNRSIVYYDSGNTFTFDVVPGGYIDDGLVSSFARDRIDNTTFYLGQDERGNIIAKRLDGYRPIRISTHAIETIWRGYSSVSDAVSYSYGFNGHSFWRIRFPSANSGRGATWEYDVSTGFWSEPFFLNSSDGEEYAHRSQCHAYAFGKHLVGDPTSGNIYELNDTFYTDDGDPIRRLRRAPHISNEAQRIFHKSLQIDLEVGLGTIPPLTTDGLTPAVNGSNWRGPQCMLRWSDDGGKTWGNEHWRDCGQAGKYKTRAIWHQLGQARDRVYEWSATDPVPWRVVDAYLDASGYGKPVQRLAERLRQQA